MWLGNKTKGQILQIYDFVVSYTHNIKVKFDPQEKEQEIKLLDILNFYIEVLLYEMRSIQRYVKIQNIS